MDDAMKAAAWAEKQLAQARALVAVHPLGPRDQTMEQHKAFVRGMVKACLRDISPYVGLTVDQADARAALLGDFLCVHRGPTGHRADWRSDRVHLRLGPDGNVQSAELDSPLPWEIGQPASTADEL
jgi:hypothetical protein